MGAAATTLAEPRSGENWWESLLQETLTATFWFDSGPPGKPQPVRIRFSGRRLGTTGKSDPADRFDQTEVIDVVPGTGPFSITTRANDIHPGEWVVTAEPIGMGKRASVRPLARTGRESLGILNPALWPWRARALSSGSSQRVRTSPAAFGAVPGVVLGGWAAAAMVGIVAGLLTEALILSHHRLEVESAITILLLVTALGVVGAKAWYVALNRKLDGWCIQGFLLFAGIAGLASLVLAHAPVGLYLDAATPAVLFGMAIGRVGCFLGGCCTGRPSGARWAVWSSDRRVGTRRIPTQLLEAALSFAVAGAALVLVAVPQAPRNGFVFVGAIAFYTLVRQGLLRLRSEPRKSRLGGVITAAAAMLVLGVDVLAALLLA